MIQAINFILVGVIIILLFGKIKGFINNRTFNHLKKRYGGAVTKLNINKPIKFTDKESKQGYLDTSKFLNASVGKVYRKDGTEAFNWTKFKKTFSLKGSGEWGKVLSFWLNFKHWAIILAIASSIFAYGWYKGRLNTPIKVNLDYNKEFKMKLNSHYLIKPKYSQNLRIEDKKGNLVKSLKAKDFPLLAEKLRPIGFCLEPIAIIGYGIGERNRSFEGGAGISFIKYWKWKVDTFLTSKGFYIGTSYSITENSGAGLGYGKGYIGDNRIIIYYKFKW